MVLRRPVGGGGRQKEGRLFSVSRLLMLLGQIKDTRISWFKEGDVKLGLMIHLNLCSPEFDTQISNF